MSAEDAPTIFLKLESSDNQVFEISQEAIKQSKVLLDFVTDDVANMAPIPVPNVLGVHLKLIVEWCEHHKGEPFPDPEVTDFTIPQWDKDFFANMDNEELFYVVNNSYYFDIPGLMHLGCKTIANMARGKSPEELRAIFGIRTDEEDEAAERAAMERELAELDVNGAGPSHAGNDRSASGTGPSTSANGSSDSGSGPSNSGTGPSTTENNPTDSGTGTSDSGADPSDSDAGLWDSESP